MVKAMHYLIDISMRAEVRSPELDQEPEISEIEAESNDKQDEMITE